VGLLSELLVAVPAVMLGWAAIRRAEALVMREKRRSSRQGQSDQRSG
jgi:hypothetical protein